MEKIVKTGANVLLALCLIVAAAYLIMYQMEIRPYIVLSGSMEPYIHTGSICFVDTGTDYAEIEEGDVITFDYGMNVPVTHRVLRITEEGMETKGDANDTSDGITTREGNFVGKTLFSIPYAGYVFSFLHTRPGKILFGTCIAVMIIGSYMIERIRSQEDD